MMRRFWLIKTMLLLVLGAGAQELASVGKNYYNVDEKGLVLKGYDPVSYFDGEPKEGDTKIEAKYQGLVYRFASKANKKKFEQNPTKYMPQYGGYCALGLGVDQKKLGFHPQRFDVDPKTYEVRGDKLYMFFKTPIWNAKKAWDAGDKEAMISQADSIWEADEKKYEGLKIPEGMSPKAPPETLQMAFLVGRWKIQFFTKSSPTTYIETEGLWYGDFTPDGMSIVDYWSTGMEVSGINVRTYDPFHHQWSMTWAQNNNIKNKALIEGKETDGKMVFQTKYWDSDPEGRFINRITFHNVTDDHFSYFIDASYDGGQTWYDKIKKIEATRISY